MATVDGGQLHSKAQTSSRVLLSSAMAYSGSIHGCITLEHLYQDADDKSFVKFLQAGSLGTMPNLRSLKLNIDGKVADFNLASLLSGNLALQTLHIKLIGEGITGGRHKANVQGSGTALRHELQENLPMRLQNLVLQGEDIENIHPAAFKVSFEVDAMIFATRNATAGFCIIE